MLICILNNNIKYTPEYTFDDCRNVFPLLFDFAVFDNRNDLFCLIEFQGRQHYEMIKYFVN